MLRSDERADVDLQVAKTSVQQVHDRYVAIAERLEGVAKRCEVPEVHWPWCVAANCRERAEYALSVGRGEEASTTRGRPDAYAELEDILRKEGVIN